MTPDVLGSLARDTQQRDAVHLAIIPCQAGENLDPGDKVCLKDGKAFGVKSEFGSGVVDPFLDRGPKKDQWFWLCLNPGSIISLRHDWNHKDFPKAEASDKEKSRVWIEAWCAKNGVEFDETMDHAQYYISHGSYWSEGGRFESMGVPDEFWDHYENVTGTVVPNDDRGSFFSCSC